MPQLDFATPLTTSQVVWGAIIFIVLYILASRFALPQVASVLEERANHIARDLENAQQAKEKSDAAAAGSGAGHRQGACRGPGGDQRRAGRGEGGRRRSRPRR